MNDDESAGTGGSSGSLVWVITGTSSGLGRALTNIALARGDRVVATARNADSIRDFTTDPKTTGRVHITSLDVRAPFAEMRALAGEVIEKWGRVDFLINNAGVGMLGISEEVGVEGYRKQLDNNFFGPLNVTNAFLPYMRAQRKGTIVFIGSRSSWRSNVPMLGTYAASKAALTAMAEALSVEVAPLGIKVLNVLPGGMRTENWKKMSLLPTSPDALLSPIVKENSNGLGRGESETRPIVTEDAASSIQEPLMNGGPGDKSMRHIADYAEMRRYQIEWMSAVVCDGDAQKCAHAVVDVVTGNRNWPDLNLLILGADAEANIRDKCHAVLRNLDEWKDVVRGVALDRK